MLSSRQFDPAASRGSAALARHRLLTDRTMRTAQSSMRSVQDTLRRTQTQSAAAPVPRPSPRAPLSPAEQRELVQIIARGFDSLYLARTVYLKDSGLTVATLLPCAAHQDRPQRISVDAAGNVSVCAWSQVAAPPRPSAVARRLALSLMGLIVVLSILALSL